MSQRNAESNIRHPQRYEYRLNLSVDEAAAALGVSPRTVRGLIARHDLPVHRIGRRVLVPLEQLAVWNRERAAD